jgi:hypothetical protein
MASEIHRLVYYIKLFLSEFKEASLAAIEKARANDKPIDYS